jgi:EAL domain-containing protein (putative c-di-GMP-specific phosphodiesterase class I)
MRQIADQTKELEPHEVLNGLPNLDPLVGRIETELQQRGGLGILSISVIRRSRKIVDDSWQDYEATLQEISNFLGIFTQRRLRSTDLLLEPILAGNTFVVLLDGPRNDRLLTLADVGRVRYRLLSGLTTHMGRRLSHAVAKRFGIFVGGALIRHDPAADGRRVIYRGLEEAMADALTQQEEETRLQALHLKQIIKKRQVNMVYQPVVDVVAQRVIGFEALARMPQKLFPKPDRVFKVASENGSLWTLERICRKRALDDLPPLDREQLLFLNIEPDSIFDPHLRRRKFLRLVEQAGLDPRRMVLEITEHTAIRDLEAFRSTLKEVRALGFKLAMDDVGAGYAGLQAIAHLRPDYIKVDMMLVRDMHLDRIKQELIETIRRFSDSTGIVLIAEGVECLAELKSLTRAGVRCAQGYLFAKPDSPPRMPKWQALP